MADSVELTQAVVVDAFSRVAQALPGALEGLAPQHVLWRPDDGSNSIGWLVWHLTRVQDDHMAGVGGVPQVWSAEGWAERFALPYPRSSIGYGQTSDDVGAFAVSDPELLLGYHRATHAMTLAVLGAMTAADYARVVDERWDPPVTAAVRVVSVVNDTTAHVGQVEYLRGLVQRNGPSASLRP